MFVGTVRLTQAFGEGNPPHRGQDIVAVQNVTILAARDGTVTRSERMGDNVANSYGEWVEIQHADGTRTRYAHMSLGSRKVTVGQEVVAGQPIGIMGSTGNSSGPHLHFEWLDSAGNLLDPSSMSGVPNVRGTYENDYEPGTIIPPEPPEPEPDDKRRRRRRVIIARRY